MTQVYTTNGYAYVASPTRYGQIKKTGPITGLEWLISPGGSWINEEDAEVLTEIDEPIWCFRNSAYIRRYMVFYAVPTRDEITRFLEAGREQ